MAFKIRFTCCGLSTPIAPPAAVRATSEGPDRADQALSGRSRSGNELPTAQPHARAQSERSLTMRMIEKYAARHPKIRDRIRKSYAAADAERGRTSAAAAVETAPSARAAGKQRAVPAETAVGSALPVTAGSAAEAVRGTVQNTSGKSGGVSPGTTWDEARLRRTSGVRWHPPAFRSAGERRLPVISGPVDMSVPMNADHSPHARLSGVRMTKQLSNKELIHRLEGNLKSLNAFAAYLDEIKQVLNSLAPDSRNNEYEIMRELTAATSERPVAPLRSLATGLGGLVQLNTDRAKLDNVTLPMDVLMDLRKQAFRIYYTVIPVGSRSETDSPHIPPKLQLFQLGDQSGYGEGAAKLPRTLTKEQRSAIKGAMASAVALRDRLATEYERLKTLDATAGIGWSGSEAGPSGMQNHQDFPRGLQAADRLDMKNGLDTVPQLPPLRVPDTKLPNFDEALALIKEQSGS